MASLVNIENTLGAGQRQKANLDAATQNREFNSLRMSGERQRQDLQQRTFDADQQRANTEKLLNGIRIAKTNPNLLPQVGQELVSSGILNESELPALLQRAQSDPQTFKQGLDDFESQLMFALGEAPQEQTFGKPQSGVDAQGNPIFGQIDPATGQSRTVEGLAPPAGSTGGNARSDFFNELTAGLSDADELSARRKQLGLEPRAVGSANITIAGDEDLTEDVADSQATIAQRKKFGEATGASRSKLIDKGFETIQAIDGNVRNMNRAIVELQNGASTGVIENRFPSFKAATLRLEQIQKELGLDVVGGVTFGALSKGELDLALDVALPRGLQPQELIADLEKRKAAQEKLRAYFSSQIDFLDQGGTVAGFMRQQDRQITEAQEPTDQSAPEGTIIKDSAGQSFIKQNGQWVPNG